MTRLGHLCDKVGVGGLHPGLHLRALGAGEFTEGRVDFRKGTLGDHPRADAQLLKRSGDHELSGHDADRPGDRARLRHDRMRRHGDVVAAGCRHVAHGHDQGLDVAREHQFAPDHFGRNGGPARAVDADHDGAHRSVRARRSDPVHERVRAEQGAARRLHRARAAHDLAGGVEQRDLRRAERGGLAVQAVVLASDPVRARHGRRIVNLVFIREGVDETRGDGVGAQVRPAVERLSDVGLGFPASLGDRAHEFVVDVAIERCVHLPVRRRHGLLREGIGGGLVVADMEQIGHDAQFVERPAEEQLVGCHARHVKRAARQEENAVCRGSDIVLGRSTALEVGGHRLARLSKIRDRGPQFLQLPPHRAAAHRRNHDGFHAIVSTGALKRRYHVAQRRPVRQERRQHARRPGFAHGRLDPQVQRGVGRHGRTTAHEGEVRHRHGDRGEDHERQQFHETRHIQVQAYRSSGVPECTFALGNACHTGLMVNGQSSLTIGH